VRKGESATSNREAGTEKEESLSNPQGVSDTDGGDASFSKKAGRKAPRTFTGGRGGGYRVPKLAIRGSCRIPPMLSGNL